MTLVDGFSPPLPCKQCWKLEKLLGQKKLTVSQPTLLCRGEGMHNYTLICVVNLVPRLLSTLPVPSRCERTLVLSGHVIRVGT